MQFQLVLTPSDQRLLQDRIKKIQILAGRGMKEFKDVKSLERFTEILNIANAIVNQTHIGTVIPHNIL